MRHPELALLSAQSHIDALEGSLPDPRRSDQFVRAAMALADTTRAALNDGPLIRLADVSFSPAMLDGLTADDAAGLINQAALGLGDDGARHVFIGAEHAFDLRQSPRNFALEAVALTSLWLTDARPDVVASVAGELPAPERGAFIRYPQTHYPQVGTGHTWTKIERVLRFAGYEGSFGDHAYLLELSAHPARTHPFGRLPSQERLAFLRRAASTLSKSSEVMIFHLPATGGFRTLTAPIAAAFLNVPIGPPTGQRKDLKNGQRNLLLKWWDGPGRRRVVCCEHLSGSAGITDAYCHALAEVLTGAPP